MKLRQNREEVKGLREELSALKGERTSETSGGDLGVGIGGRNGNGPAQQLKVISKVQVDLQNQT